MATRVNAQSRQTFQWPPFFGRLLTVMLVATFLAAGAYVGYLFYFTVKDVVAHSDLPTAPYVNLTLPAVNRATSDAPASITLPRRGGELPVTGITGVPLPNYEQKERVNILLLGIDKRPSEKFARTDTVILATVDPYTGNAGLMSIPRDLWVTIPGYGENRINTAFYSGEKNAYPGGGSALAMKTVQYNLGIPVHFYVKVDFEGFRQIVDALGGIEVEVPYAINDPTYPDNDYGYDPFYIAAGRQHLDGTTALKYARTRHAPGADFGRAARQQQVLLAIRERALQLDIVPKLPELWASMAGTVETDLQLVDILELAALANDIEGPSIQQVVIDDTMTVDWTTEFGAQVLLPLRERIRAVVDSMFAETEPQGPTPEELQAAQAAQAAAQAAAIQDQIEQQEALIAQLNQESATIVVQNGTSRVGMAGETAHYLRQLGFDVVQFGAADLADYSQTVIVDYSGKKFSIRVLAELFNVSEENIRRSPNLKSEVDIRIIIGADFEVPTEAKATSLFSP
jgi:polyisoprenyl-teichoic acid--peptidoglycan teichoic acid transferase